MAVRGRHNLGVGQFLHVGGAVPWCIVTNKWYIILWNKILFNYSFKKVLISKIFHYSNAIKRNCALGGILFPKKMSITIEQSFQYYVEEHAFGFTDHELIYTLHLSEGASKTFHFD